ncbi:MAG: hypothetical protein KBT03_02360 [Bacteroidales bacterium]|nr:hypothetical protein [Candidatus Scybalousia scybalohippi]
MLNIVIERKKSSYDYKINEKAESSFSNNWNHNSEDWFVLFDDKAEIMRVRCQSVANYNWGEYATADTCEYGDTIHEGYFKVKCFVEPRGFHGEIHGIVETKDIDGQWIGRDSMQTTKDGFQNGRWLIHDRFSKKLGKDSNYAWSAGCIILSELDLKAFNSLLKVFEVKPGDIISGEIVEVD